LFEKINEVDDNIIFQIKLSILQIYKEVVYDLLSGEKDLKIKENPIKGIYVDGLTEVYIDSFENFMEYIEYSQEQRIEAATRLNRNSSRSHVIVQLEVTQNIEKENITKKGTLNLVDLAGSEKVSKTGAVGDTLEEAKKINLSLSVLGNVIHSLSSPEKCHIPYRDSKLTRILQESLGGNYKTSLIVTCSPHSYNHDESMSTLKFAQRAKRIKNKVKMNIKLSYEQLQKIIEGLKNDIDFANKEINRLKEAVGESVYIPADAHDKIFSTIDSTVDKFFLDLEKNDKSQEEKDHISKKDHDCECELKDVLHKYKILTDKLEKIIETKEEYKIKSFDNQFNISEYRKYFEDVILKDNVNFAKFSHLMSLLRS
jgi:kinesin family protein 5